MAWEASKRASITIEPRRMFAASACVGALANVTLLVIDPTTYAAPLLRVVTGACMAGVYPIGMKLASTWAKGDMGLMVGILVGALTLGSASPHLVNAFGGVNWRIPLAVASASALAAGALIGLAGVGPNRAPTPRFEPRAVMTAWRDLPLAVGPALGIWAMARLRAHPGSKQLAGGRR